MRFTDHVPRPPGPACPSSAAEREPFPGWYAHCAAYLALPARLQRPVSRQTLATYRRIRRLPRAWGHALDERGAPLGVMRWIAWGETAEERARRYEEMLAQRERSGGWRRPASTGAGRRREVSVDLSGGLA